MDLRRLGMLAEEANEKADCALRNAGRRLVKIIPRTLKDGEASFTVRKDKGRATCEVTFADGGGADVYLDGAYLDSVYNAFYMFGLPEARAEHTVRFVYKNPVSGTKCELRGHGLKFTD